MISEAVKGNVTTIVKMAIMTLGSAGYVDVVTQDTLISVVVGVICLILAYFDARYPNTFIEDKTACECPEPDTQTIEDDEGA